jgi:hypothetical protein
MAKTTTTSQMKNNTIPGSAYPATVLPLTTGPSYPGLADLLGKGLKSVIALMSRF